MVFQLLSIDKLSTQTAGGKSPSFSIEELDFKIIFLQQNLEKLCCILWCNRAFKILQEENYGFVKFLEKSYR